jgi:hypothetical protein
VSVWELKSGRVDAFAPLVLTTADRARAALLFADAKPKEWNPAPSVEFLVDKRTKKLSRADVPMLVPGALALTSRAKEALGPLLSRFGQLLQLDCKDQPVWYFNVTTVIDCLDRQSPAQRKDGSPAKETFLSDKLPTDATIFKEPSRLRSRIYVNDAARAAIEAIVADAGLTGIAIVEPGAA